MPGRITPNGLLQLLQTCRSLSSIALAIDARGYTEFTQSPGSLGLTLSPTFSFDAFDSILAAESAPTIPAFLAGIALRFSFSFRAYSGWSMNETDDMGRWYDAYDPGPANDTLSRCS